MTTKKIKFATKEVNNKIIGINKIKTNKFKFLEKKKNFDNFNNFLLTNNLSDKIYTKNEILENNNLVEILEKFIKDNEVEHLKKPKINNNIKQLYRLFKILECNRWNKKTKVIKNTYINDIETDVKYQETLSYNCNLSNCLKCKRKKHFNYLKDRILDNSYFNEIYFITLSSTFLITNKKKYLIETKELRQNIRNVFSYLRIPFFSSLEKGEIGSKLHLHLLVFLNTKADNFKTSIYITDLLRATTGFYTFSKIVRSKNKDKLIGYVAKMVGYSTKFMKDKKELNKDNFIELSENNFNLIKDLNIDDIRNKLKKIKWNKKELIKGINTSFYSSSITKNFIEYTNLYNKNEFKNMTNKDRFFILLSLAFVSQQTVFEKGIKDIKNKAYNEIKKKSTLAYKTNKTYHIEKTMFNLKVENKLIDFSDRFLISIKTKLSYYLELLELLKNSEFKDNKIYNRMFFTSDIKKRILSNISIYQTTKLKFIGNVDLIFKENTQKNIYKGIDIKKIKHHYDYNSIVHHSLNLRYREYRIESEIDKAIYKNNIMKENESKNKNLAFLGIIQDSLYRISEKRYKKFEKLIKTDKEKYIKKTYQDLLKKVK